MEDLQTDTLSDYSKNQNPQPDLLVSKDPENACAGNLLNGCEEIDDPLDLMDHCENESIGSNSDVWKGSDSEEENFDNKNGNSETNKSAKETELETGDTIEINAPPPENPDNAKQPEPTEAAKIDDSAEKIDLSESAPEEPGGDDEKLPETEQTSKDNSIIESEEPEVVEQPQQEDEPPKDPEKDSNNLEGIEETPVNDTVQETSPIAIEDDSPGEDTQEKDPVPENTPVGGDDAAEVEKDPVIAEVDPAGAEEDSAVVEISDKDPLASDVPESAPAQPDRNNEGEDNEEEMDYNDEDDDFDPSLLCPEVSMAVDESPVITNSGQVPNEGNADSPLPYEPLYSTFVDEVTGAEISFNLTAEEQELRKRLYGPTNPVQISKIHCTACNVHLGSALDGQNNRFVHPLLKVLICKECYHFYTSGEFEKDEDGSELYCRWCGQGGQVLCCSKCEFVFCKRCIRTNFGRKKMFEIRDSDCWDCFRCVPSQIITQRIACFEFFEYERRERSRASTLNSPEVWSKDHTRCCQPKKRALENGEQEMKKSKKRKGEMDPDYNPLLNKSIVIPSLPTQILTGSTNTATTTTALQFPGNKIVLNKPVSLFPRYGGNKSKDNDIEFVRHIPAPQVALNPIRPNVAMPAYRTILPSHVRPVMQPPTLVRINAQQLPPPLVPTGNRLLGNALQGRCVNSPNMMKHEWFEKTVRAAARVNSHLSYTLTQLNKAQSQAASVEELAVVHNKLQEILSSSINSLIQIRKNLRTEFIAGIKTVRLPSKKTDSFANDDDVIFVSAPSTMPVASTSKAPPAADPIIIIDKPNKPPAPTITTTTRPSEAIERPKCYLKVKSVMELQNVPAECITIPDDTPAPPRPQAEAPNDTPPQINTNEVVCNGVSIVEDKTPDPKTPDPKVKTPDPKSKTPDPKNKTPASDSKAQSSKKAKLEIKANLSEQAGRETRTRRSKGDLQMSKTVYNMKDEPSPDIKRMLAVTVKLPRVDLVDLQKRLPNGCH